MPRTTKTRREFCLDVLRAGATATAASACGPLITPRPSASAQHVFRHGVASGDPLADRVILWTRVSSDGSAPVATRWRIALDPEMRRVVGSGSLQARAENDFTLKVDASELEPHRHYYYAFEALGERSPVGRTKTLPKGRVDRVRLAVASCSNYAFGYFNAYALIAQREDLDAVVHLGDYLYEHANGTYGDGTALGRIPAPDAEILSLADYRTRHAQYKTDPDLQEVHRHHPFIAVWDDHESANDAWSAGAENHDPATEGAWSARRAAAVRAYFEWMPIRDLPPSGDGHIYRSFRFGDLADLIMLDTRLEGRDRPARDADDLATIRDRTRRLIGPAQERWFLDELSRSKHDGIPWRLIGQQVMFAPLRSADGAIVNPDQWNGYAASRERVFRHLAEGRIDNLVVLTGDFHSSWALDLPPDPSPPGGYDPETGKGSLGVEFVVPGITAAPPLQDQPEQQERFRASLLESNAHLRFTDWRHRGYVLIDVQRERVRSEWYFLDTVLERSRAEHLGAAYEVRSGTAHLVEKRIRS
jgi:alkaline phosphatase D